MNMLELLKHVSELSLFETTIFTCEEEDYKLLFNYGSLSWYEDGNPDPRELRTHEILSLIESGIIYTVEQ